MSARPNDSKILVVESHRRLAPGVSAVIGDARLAVEEARDAAEALAAVARGGVALVVVDDDLAGGDPFELCRNARAADGTPAIVLLASSYLAATRIRAARYGVDELIPKPAAISEVLTRIWLALRRRQLTVGAGASALAMPVAEPPDLGLTLLDAVELMIAGGRVGRVAVASGGRRRGWVAISDGLVVDAQAGPLRGAPALGRLFRWRLTRAEQLIEPVREKVMAVTSADLCAALFQVRYAWPRMTRSLPLDSVLALDFESMAPTLPAMPGRMHAVVRLFDGRRRLIDVLDDADIPDPEVCRFVAELLDKHLLVPCAPPPEVNSHWDAPSAAPDLFFSAQAPDVETPVGFARSEDTPPPPRRTITSETAAVEGRAVVTGELLPATISLAPVRPRLSDTGTKLGWAALAAGGMPFDGALNVASATGTALRSTMPATPSILITDLEGLDAPEDGPAGAAVTALHPSPTPVHQPPHRPTRDTLRLHSVRTAAVSETTDPMIAVSSALDPPPSVRSHSEAWPVEPPPRRRALAMAGLGAVLGVAGSLFVCVRVGGPVAPPSASVSRSAPAGIVVTPRGAGAVAPPRPTPTPTPTTSTSPTTSTATSTTATTTTTTAAAAAVEPTLEDCRRAYVRERYSRIVRVCARALEVDGEAEGKERAGAMAMLAHAELDRGNYQRARGWARKALALDPRLPEAYAYLGFVEDQAGRRDEALMAYRSYLELAPRGRYAEDIRAIITAGP